MKCRNVNVNLFAQIYSHESAGREKEQNIVSEVLAMDYVDEAKESESRVQKKVVVERKLINAKVERAIRHCHQGCATTEPRRRSFIWKFAFLGQCHQSRTLHPLLEVI